MLDRLLGVETEYAIRFSPAVGGSRPGNDTIYAALASALASLVATRPGDRRAARKQFFTENGGAFCYESLPKCPDGGLMEGATPECRGPSQLLVYQKAQEELLLRALPKAQAQLARQGFVGSPGTELEFAL